MLPVSSSQVESARSRRGCGLIISTLTCVESLSCNQSVINDAFSPQIIRHMNFSTESTTAASLPASSPPTDEDPDLKEKDPSSVADHEAQTEADILPVNNINDASDQDLYKDFKESVVVTVIVFVLLCIVIPAFAAIPKVWTKAGFVVWVVITL